MNWIQSVMMGFISGLCEPSPVSAEAHRGLLRHLFGIESEGPLFLLLCHVAVLTVLLSAGQLEQSKLRRAAKLLKTPKRRRSGQLDLNSAGTNRMIRGAAIFAVIGGVLTVSLNFITRRLWMLAIPLFLGGLILWLPTQFRSANRDGRHMTAAEGILMGLAALVSAVPGISPVGTVTAVGSLLGADRRFALRFAWILLCFRLAGAIVTDIMALAGTGLELTLGLLLPAVLGAAAAAGGSYFSIQSVRSLTRPGGKGLADFCYFNWGHALLCALLFLLV